MAPARKSSQVATPKGSGIWYEILKAASIAVVTGCVGYASGLIIPPGALYDRFARQDPNKFTGTWVGAVGGWTATMNVRDVTERTFTGTILINAGDATPRVVPISGNHDSETFIVGKLNDGRFLKIGLVRKIGERFGPDDGFVLLTPKDGKAVAAKLCDKDNNMDTASHDCPPFGDGSAFFSRDRRDGNAR